MASYLRGHGRVPDRPTHDGGSDAGAPASLITRLWDELVEILGAAATAALLRRSIKRASEVGAALDGLTVRREHLTYALSVPSWTEAQDHAALEAIVRELSPLLVELTGHVVVRRLSLISEFRNSGIHFAEGEP